MRRIWTHENLRNESLITKLSEHKGEQMRKEKVVENVTLLETCWKALLENEPFNNASELKLYGNITSKNFPHAK